MRIVSYNILDGGEGRADPLAEVLLAQHPDIVALLEADDPAVLDRIGLRLHMDFVHARGGRKGAAILSRWPIRESIDHGLLCGGNIKSLLEATIVEPHSAAEWTVGVVHLKAKAREEDEREREKEIRIVLDAFAAHRASGRPHLLAGDFNANSPIQQIDPDKCKPATRQAWHENGGSIPRRVVQTVLGAGYVDTLYAVDPGRASTIGTFTTQYPGQRIDYVFAYGFEHPMIRHAWVEQDRLAKYASDHFPVGAEILR